jgi:hypothetical protein
MNEHRWPICLSAVSLAVMVAFARMVQPYSVTSPWSRFDKPGQRYLMAALDRDSVRLGDLAVSPAAVAWALRMERSNRNTLAIWARFARASVGFERGDTTDVWFDAPTSVCPVLLTFVGQNNQAKVLRAYNRCLRKLSWPEDKSVISVSR